MSNVVLSKMSHADLVRRAVIWLRGKHHDPVLTGIASCDEIPDAIGWNSQFSTVIECKTSKSDFAVDRWKYVGFQHPQYLKMKPYRAKSRMRENYIKNGYQQVALPNMGVFRYYMSEPGIVTPEMVAKEHPDHGLIHIIGKTSRVIVPAPLRVEGVNLQAETRYLRFALVHLRDNLGKRGITCDLLKSTLYFGDDGIKICPQGRLDF